MILEIEDHTIFGIKITKKHDPKNEDHKNTQIKIMRSQSKTRPKSHDHEFTTKWIMDQIIFRSQIIRSNYFPVPDHKIKMFSYLRSQDQIIFIYFRSQDQIIFGFQITRSNYFPNTDHKIT